ncbi:ribosomal-protein-alanine N-acetyltransferase [Lactiplantibacillus garii]|uniref:[Ribosomal protein bS18]-alanine N-acetyltransferase n=1 Tax=Lactiplantibacillus garii TaxID=2306423 RepID=A0A3R8JA86_9LACO|nr:ribosomal protein S18-alanine N-acetyltransferase [Lactiplantibacillus garii]RRK11816.1 ribosomal-protein-alanine N-acetyltransferase [Lactiplantibacillus garii]
MTEGQLVSGTSGEPKQLAATCYQLAAVAYPNGAPWRQATFQADIEAPQTRYDLLLLGGHPVGFASWTVVLDQVELTNLAVHPDFRRQGLAEQLLNAGLTRLKISDQVFLEVRQSNVAAQRLYLKAGFGQIATRKRYYHDPTEDAWIMRKIID